MELPPRPISPGVFKRFFETSFPNLFISDLLSGVLNLLLFVKAF